MRAAKKTGLDKKILQELVPLNALSPERFREVSDKILVEEVKSGRYLFRKGDRDNQSIYLLEGQVNLIDGFRKVASEVVSGTDISRYPISNVQPRAVSARAAKKSIIARIDSSLLDAFLTWDQSSGAEVVEIGADEHSDWMTRMLQSEAFMKIPPAMIQSLLMKMRSVEMNAGDTVIRQGDEGEYFVTIQQGRCAVTRRDAEDSDEQLLAELTEGDSFGEDSLVSGTKRNATVSMLTDGVVMRLAKEDFVALLQEPLVNRVNYETAATMVNEGAVWVDVRMPDEYEDGSFEDSVNIPLATLRGEVAELVFNAKYVMCCDTGRRSCSAAFMLSRMGFDVYMLDGGIAGMDAEALDQAGLSGELLLAAVESCLETEIRLDEVVEFEDGLHEVTDTASTVEASETAATVTAAESATDAGTVTADLEVEVEELRAWNEMLAADLEQYRTTETRLTEQLELLRGELGESGAKLADLYAQARADSEEKQRLQEESANLQENYGRQLQVLQSELEETREQLTRLQSQADDTAGQQSSQAEIQQLQEDLARAIAEAEEKQRLREESASLHEDQVRQLQSALEEARQQLTEQQSQADAATGQQQQLLEEAAATQQSSQAEIQQLQEELARASSRMQALEDDLAAARETLPAEHAAVLQEQQERVTGLQHALEQAEQERVTSEKDLQSELQDRVALSDRLGEELAAMREKFQQVTEDLAAAASQSEELEQRNTELVSGVESLQQKLDDSRQQMEQQAAAAETDREALERRIEEISSDHQQDSERLSTVSADHEAAVLRIQSLEEELEALRAARREAGTQLQEQVERADNMAASRQAAEEALERQQADRDAERARHGKELGELQESIEDLRAELGTAQEQAATEKTALEEQLQQLRTEHSAQLEQYEVQLLEHQQHQSEQATELQDARVECDNWQQKCNALTEENSQLQQDVAGLNDQVATLAGSADEQLQELQSGLNAGQQRILELEQAGIDKDAQLAALQEEISAWKESIGEGERQQELLQQQLDGLQQELVEHDERARLDQLESQESIRKAHEDLTRKNDNEKELQGQIVRLRKKLEQSTLEQQQVREDAQVDIDNIRDELHAERQARAEERAEMAARQRELKEQLTAVASEHESNLNNQSGAIEDARDAAREEERVRLQDLLNNQQQTEEQLQKLQQELQQAHAESARLHQQEKERRQAGTGLLQEQNAQAEAAIEQLESQLKQLTQERDQSLEEQQTLREKLNVLRGEVEVARGLMNVEREGQVEDPVRLRSELEETRKNVEISVRLRAEAEAARDQLIRERDALRELLEGDKDVELPLHVPALDEDASHASPAQAETPRVSSSRADVTTGKVATPPQEEKTSQKHSWSRVLNGIVMVGISAGLFWLMLDSEEPGQPSGGNMDTTPDMSAAEAPASAAATLLPETVKDTPAVAAALPAAPEAVERPAPVAVDSVPGTAQAVKKPVTPVVKATPAPVIQKPDVPEQVAAAAPAPATVPVFRDQLKNGSKGPLMAELPGASYMMGSSGNSLNFDEGPRHRVTLTGFSISKHEVSFSEYDRFARATGRRLPHDEGWGRKDRPVINVSWHDANAYAAWLSKQTGKTYRLPAESEWEYAARAGSLEQYWWGGAADTVPANCFNCGSKWGGSRTAPVGSFAANNFGLHDMAGNVQEWTQDCYRAGYVDAPVDGSARLAPECTQRAVRGGAYTSPQDSLRSARRGQYDQDTRLDNLGFRVVREN